MTTQLREWAAAIKPGDELTPKALWNDTERSRKLATPTVVLGVQRARNCGSGVMLDVAFKSGARGWLDAGWFYEGDDDSWRAM